MLQLTGIRAGYDGVQVLHGVDLVVPSGATVALLGANGAGKTTLLRVAAGLLAPRAGSVVFDGGPVDREHPHHRARRGLCLIPEGGGIFRPLTVRENIAMFAEGRDVPGAVDTVLGAFPALEQFLDLEAGRLSGGQQQMLAVSRGFLVGVEVILADELSMGLAPVAVDAIFEAVRRMPSEGRSLLLVEQYVDRALDIADYVYVLHKGRVVMVGEPDQCRHSALFDQYLGDQHEHAVAGGGRTP